MTPITPEDAAFELRAQQLAIRVAEILKPQLWPLFKDRLALEIGTSILKKIAWVIGLAALALLFFLVKKGIVNLPNV